MSSPPLQPDSKEAVEARLCAYLEGDLTPAERADLEHHLAQNPVHRQLLSDLALARSWLRALPAEKAPPEVGEVYREQAERSILMGEDAPPHRRAVQWRQYALVAALVVGTLGLATGVALLLSGPGRKPIAPVAMNPSTPATQPGVDAVATVPADTRAAVGALPMVGKPPGGQGQQGQANALATNSAPELSTAVDAAASNQANAAPAPTLPPSAVTVPQQPFAMSQTLDAPQMQAQAESRTVHLIVTTADPAAVDDGIRRLLSTHEAPSAANDRSAKDASGGQASAIKDGGRPGMMAARATTPVKAAAAKQAPASRSTFLADRDLIDAGRRYVAVGLTPDQAVRLAAGLKVAAGPGGDVLSPPPATTGPAIVPGQTITVIVPQLASVPGLSATHVVRVSPDGTIALPKIDPVPAAGATPDRLADRIATAYDRLVPRATVTVVPAEALVLSTTTRPASAPAIAGATTVVIEVRPLPAPR